ncbi:MAG: hypothetical protein LBS92_05945 [Candidatus Methanoplasma sp.]|jgi:hypothetical protein|nr:hypothetical protein [Candidatus Methanoplasma sp.]
MTDKAMAKIREDEFAEVVSIIDRAWENAYKAVNHEFITLHWNIGRLATCCEFLSIRSVFAKPAMRCKF